MTDYIVRKHYNDTYVIRDYHFDNDYDAILFALLEEQKSPENVCDVFQEDVDVYENDCGIGRKKILKKIA